MYTQKNFKIPLENKNRAQPDYALMIANLKKEKIKPESNTELERLFNLSKKTAKDKAGPERDSFLLLLRMHQVNFLNGGLEEEQIGPNSSPEIKSKYELQQLDFPNVKDALREYVYSIDPDDFQLVEILKILGWDPAEPEKRTAHGYSHYQINFLYDYAQNLLAKRKIFFDFCEKFNNLLRKELPGKTPIKPPLDNRIHYLDYQTGSLLSRELLGKYQEINSGPFALSPLGFVAFAYYREISEIIAPGHKGIHRSNFYSTEPDIILVNRDQIESDPLYRKNLSKEYQNLLADPEYRQLSKPETDISPGKQKKNGIAKLRIKLTRLNKKLETVSLPVVTHELQHQDDDIIPEEYHQTPATYKAGKKEESTIISILNNKDRLDLADPDLKNHLKNYTKTFINQTVKSEILAFIKTYTFNQKEVHDVLTIDYNPTFFNKEIRRLLKNELLLIFKAVSKISGRKFNFYDDEIFQLVHETIMEVKSDKDKTVTQGLDAFAKIGTFFAKKKYGGLISYPLIQEVCDYLSAYPVEQWPELEKRFIQKT